MNYTANYKLPQWVETDRILMEDFNAAMDSIGKGLGRKAESESVAQIKTSLEENLENLASLMGTGGSTCRIARGTYQGNGAYGSANPTVFTFDFKPLVVFVAQTANEQSQSGFFCVVRGMPISVFNFTYCGNLIWSDKGLSIYSDSSADNQWNRAQEYCYVAIGVDE